MSLILNSQNINIDINKIQPAGLEEQPTEKMKVSLNMFTWKWLFSEAAKLLSPIIGLITPEIKTELENFVLSLFQKAKATPNQWDDFLINILASILNIKLPD